MKVAKDTCQTCGCLGYIFCICHERENKAAIHECICGGCLADRIEKINPVNEKLVAYYRATKI